MISVVISMYGKASILFVDPKVRMNGVHYCTLVLKILIPQMSRLCPNFILEQDGTRCYIPAYTLPYIGPHVPQLLEPEFWSPLSPDLNPLNYCLWDYVETVIRNHQNVGDFDQLKTKIAKSWKTISQRTIDRAILTFRKRLQMCSKANGGDMKHYFSVSLELALRLKL